MDGSLHGYGRQAPWLWRGPKDSEGHCDLYRRDFAIAVHNCCRAHQKQDMKSTNYSTTTTTRNRTMTTTTTNNDNRNNNNNHNNNNNNNNNNIGLQASPRSPRPSLASRHSWRIQCPAFPALNGLTMTPASHMCSPTTTRVEALGDWNYAVNDACVQIGPSIVM